MEHDDVKFSAACGNTSRHFTDSPQHTQLLQQTWRDPAADVAHNHGLARLNTEDVGGIHTHVGATDDDCAYLQERLRKRHPYGRSSLSGESVVPFQHRVEFTHGVCPPSAFDRTARRSKMKRAYA